MSLPKRAAQNVNGSERRIMAAKVFVLKLPENCFCKLCHEEKK